MDWYSSPSSDYQCSSSARTSSVPASPASLIQRHILSKLFVSSALCNITIYAYGFLHNSLFLSDTIMRSFWCCNVIYFQQRMPTKSNILHDDKELDYMTLTLKLHCFFVFIANKFDLIWLTVSVNVSVSWVRPTDTETIFAFMLSPSDRRRTMWR